jgi:uncharacterized protein YegP (UPF0339 family)
MAGHFEIESRSDGQFAFSMKVGNQAILTSEAYTTKDACVNGIESVKNNAPDENRYRRTTTPEGTFRFALSAANGQVVGSSAYYETAAERDEAVEFMRKNAPDAEVRDLT